MNIIGLAGRAGVGKDTVADVLVSKYDYVKVAFADPLKRVAADLWQFSTEQLWGPSSERNKPDARWPKDHVWRERRCARCDCVSTRPETCDWACVALSPREALQLLGTEIGRQIHEDTWKNYLYRVAEKLLGAEYGWHYSPREGLRWSGGPEAYAEEPQGVVVPDVRFPNEANFIQKVGGRMWLIDRPGIGLDGHAGAHVSESSLVGWDKFDRVLRNGTLEDLNERIAEAFR